MTKRILAPYATYGNGHKSVAMYIKEYFSNQEEDVIVEPIDILEYAHPVITKITKKVFEKTMFSRVPVIWEGIYKFYDNKYRSIGSKRMCYAAFDNERLRKKIIDFNPDIIISTHYFASILCAKYMEENLIGAKMYTIITDYEVHELCLKSIDYEEALIVGNKDLKRDLLKRGIPSSKIKVFGIPIANVFETDLDQERLKKKLKIDNQKLTLLFLGGGNNSKAAIPFFKQLLLKKYHFNIIFIAGRNNIIKEKVERLVEEYSASEVKILGFVDDIHEYMAASDVVISKPGGLTVSECLSLNKPMIIINRNAGQEKRNYKFLVRNKFALKAPRPRRFANYLNLININPGIITRMHKNIVKSGNNEAMKKLYDLVMK